MNLINEFKYFHHWKNNEIIKQIVEGKQFESQDDFFVFLLEELIKENRRLTDLLLGRDKE